MTSENSKLRVMNQQTRVSLNRRWPSIYEKMFNESDSLLFMGRTNILQDVYTPVIHSLGLLEHIWLTKRLLMLQLLCIYFSNISLQQNKEHVCKNSIGLLATA